jgi:hypothetical protein
LDAANAKSRDNGAIMGAPSGFSNSQIDATASATPGRNFMIWPKFS